MDGGIHVCSNEGSRPSPRGDMRNNEIILKIFFLKFLTGPISGKHGTTHLWIEGIHVYSNERPRPFFRWEIIAKM